MSCASSPRWKTGCPALPFLDVFIAIDADTDGGGTCEFELTPQDVAELTRLGLPVRFTVTVVKE